MDIWTATEQAYQNGYENGREDAYRDIQDTLLSILKRLDELLEKEA